MRLCVSALKALQYIKYFMNICEGFQLNKIILCNSKYLKHATAA